MTAAWRTYFDDLESQSPLYRKQSALYVESLDAAMGLHQGQRVLDFGCGFGFVAALLAPRVGEVLLWDPSPTMRSVAERTTAGLSNVSFWFPSEQSEDSERAEPWGRIPAFDLVLVNSVVQYMTYAELSTWVVRWGAMLSPGGAVVLSDLISPDRRGLSDVVDLLRLGARHGSPFRAVREALGGVTRYWRTSRAAPLTRVGRSDLERPADDAGLAVTALPGNLTHFSKRWTAVLRPRTA